MFERYTEKARRVIFFARYEASQFGSPYIETEHLLLGILREDKALTNRFLRSHTSVESIRQQIEKATTIREKVSTSVDLPLSNESKRILAYAAEEAERLYNKHIGTEHLFLGILREENSFAAGILKERGIQIDSARAQLVDLPPQPAAPLHAAAGAPASSIFRDLTQAAQEGALHPVIDRDKEVAAAIEVLCTQGKFPLLVGPHGAGKTAVVHALAQRIAGGAVPPRLADARVIEAEPSEFAKLFAADPNPKPAVLFIDLSQRLSALQARAGSHSLPVFLRWVHAHPNLQCVAVADESEFTGALKSHPWLLDIFREIHIHPLDKQSVVDVVRARKTTLEKFHGISYSDASVEAALHAAAANPSCGSILQTALDLLDAAGARATLTRSIHPEIAEAQKKVRSIADRHEHAIVNHEFEKARFYSDEERKERENLRLVGERLGVAASSVIDVTPDDIQQVLIRWSTYPYAH